MPGRTDAAPILYAAGAPGGSIRTRCSVIRRSRTDARGRRRARWSRRRAPPPPRPAAPRSARRTAPAPRPPGAAPAGRWRAPAARASRCVPSAPAGASSPAAMASRSASSSAASCASRWKASTARGFQALEGGQDLGAHPVAPAGRVGVRRVEQVADAGLVQQRRAAVRAAGSSSGRTIRPRAPGSRAARQPAAAREVAGRWSRPRRRRCGRWRSAPTAGAGGQLLEEAVARQRGRRPRAIGARRARGRRHRSRWTVQASPSAEAIGATAGGIVRARSGAADGRGGRPPGASGGAGRDQAGSPRSSAIESGRRRRRGRGGVVRQPIGPVGDRSRQRVEGRGGSGGRIRTTGQGLMSPLLYH